MKKLVLFAMCQFLLVLTANASSYIWSSAIPTQVHIVPEGLLLLGDFKNTDVNCTDPIIVGSIFLPKDDPSFDMKVSLALTANAAGKKIEVLLFTGAESQCIQISATGYTPKAYHYYWRLKD